MNWKNLVKDHRSKKGKIDNFFIGLISSFIVFFILTFVTIFLEFLRPIFGGMLWWVLVAVVIIISAIKSFWRGLGVGIGVFLVFQIFMLILGGLR